MLKKASSIRKAIGAVSLLWFGSLAGSGLAFFTQVILARELTPAGYGVFAAALATITLLAPLAGFGVHSVWLKVFGAEGWLATRWLAASYWFVSLSTMMTLLLLSAWIVWGPHVDSVARLLTWLIPVIFSYLAMELVTSKLLLEERFRSLALWQLLPHFARLALILIVVYAMDHSSDVEVIAIVYALVAFVVFAIGFTSLKAMISGRLALKGHSQTAGSGLRYFSDSVPATVSAVAAQAWPFGLATIFHLIYFQSDILLLKYLTGDEAAGIYNVGFTVMAAVYLLPSAVYQKFLLPKVHRWANHDRKRFYEVYRKGNIAMLVIGVVAMLAIWASAFWVVPLLFGVEYQQSVIVLNILAISAPLMFVASSVGATLVTQQHMTSKVKYMGVVAVLNITLNFALIPGLGIIGAAVATVISNLALLVIYYVAAQYTVFRSELKCITEVAE
ncbi:oligosaccharide flippase family protein [Microbulbifer variabilis]|uniref:oligosaccharide flippase family protein n=1 Tax=Microbulbifer variabilis TaxID=266805 RepID=UPI00036E6828|nr:oligosaccharide flippase family protein [Microbulbifer variabilis]